MALINNNVKAYQQYKTRKAIQDAKDQKINNLEEELSSLRSLIDKLINTKPEEE